MEKKQTLSRSNSGGITFDVNSFLRKTLSDYNNDQSISNHQLPDQPPLKHHNSQFKAQRDRRKNNRASLDSEHKMEPSSASEFSQLMAVPNFEETNTDNAIEEKLRRKITPSPSRVSLTSASSLRPLCRICHLSGDINGNGEDQLISPCRCAGTMQFVHTSCLVVRLL